MDAIYDNGKILAWHEKNFNSLKSEMDALGIKHEKRSPSPKALRNAITKKYRTRNGIIDKLSYGMPRSAIYVHKGVGKDTPIAKQGTTARKAKRWYSNPLDRNLPDLQEIVADADASYVLNNLTIK